MTDEAAWEQFAQRVQIDGSPSPLRGDWPEAARSVGLRQFPPSYLAYLRRFGLGTWKPQMQIGAAEHQLKPATVRSMTQSFRDMAEVMVEAGDRAERERVLRMVCFGGDGSGLSLCWDVTMGERDGELAICLVNEETLDIYECSFDLLDFLDRIWGKGEINRILHQDRRTKAHFTPYVVPS